MKAQLILYDQCNTRYINPDIKDVFCIVSHKAPVGPYGTLQLNPFSKILEYAITKAFIEELVGAGFRATWMHDIGYEEGILRYCKQHKIKTVHIMEPSEHYLFVHLKKIAEKVEKQGIYLVFEANTQFLIPHTKFQQKYTKPPVLENFYRWMRAEKNILMEGGKPVGGQWNYDKENRTFDKKHKPVKHIQFSHSYINEAAAYYGYQSKDKTSSEGAKANSSPKGEYDVSNVVIDTQAFDYPVTREQALQLLHYFIEHHLDNFGRLEDAMYTSDGFVYHSRVSTALHFGLLTPEEVVKAVENTDSAINNKEGYIRQVLGWREYMYHRFWNYKESIYTENFHNYTTALPLRFWEPQHSPLQMHCLNTVLKQVQQTGYSHHITRLMVIGNFCQLAGFNPHDVNKRFWEMYADAFEWVVTPNVLGMSQFADGGKLATKPYVSSANYINNMSDYCKECVYDPKEKYGETACPFNYLYWNYVDKNQELFIKGRQPFIVKNLLKVDMDKIRAQVKSFLQSLSKID